MGAITTGTGLVSGIDIASIIDSLIALESAPKTTLQSRIAVLQGQQTALLDINARLLNLKNSAAGFRKGSVFQSVLATSGNADVLDVTATKKAQPGSYQFIVKQLVANSQKLSGGFADANTTPLGLSSMSFEFGKGTLTKDTDLDHLNGGAGVNRGKIVITDTSGAQSTVDLTDAVSINEVLQAINADDEINVSAAIDGDRLVITDNAGGGGTLSIANGANSTMATELGINTVDNGGGDADATAGVIAGARIHYVGANTALEYLNGGKGVLIRENIADLVMTLSDGKKFEVDLGRIDAPIENSTLLSELNNGAGVTIGGSDNPDLTFVDRDGNEYEVELSGVTTVGQLRSRVAAQTGGRINLDLTDGERFTVVDTVGTGSGNLIVKGAGDNDTDTAEDLGILNVTGVAASSFDGELIPNTIEAAPVATIQQLLDRINDATDTLGAANAGRLVASINATGDGIVLQDTTGGGGNFIILGAPGTSGSANAAKDLGIFTGAAGVAAPTVESGEALIATLNSTLVRDLNGGLGLNGASTLEITDRDGDFVSIGSLDQYTSVTQLLEAINTAIADAVNVDVSVTLNENGNGFRVVDSSGATASNLVVGGDAADAFGIAGDVAADRIDGANAQTRYVGEASLLTSLNYGRGVGTGSFRITDSLGQTATVSIDGDSRTLYDVIAEINSRGLSINARVNDNGDGLLIESTAGSGGFVPLKIESLSGTVASGLNIVGSADTSVDGFIDGSYERTVDLSTSDTLSEVVAKINAAAGVPASATIINTGAATNPFRLSITSEIGGRRGELTIDSTGADVDFSTMSVGKDAKVIFGGSADTGFLLTSTTNTITDAVEGLTLTLKSVSDTPVTVNVERDTAGIVQKASEFVVAFNDAIGRIDDYDKYDVDTEERGILLGNPLTARARNALFRLVFTRAEGISSSYQTLREVGISVGSGGSINFDEDKFLEAYEADPDAVENLFTALAEAPVTSEEIAPGITVINGGTTTTQRGIGEIIDDLLNAFTDSIDGSFKRAGDGIQSQIDGMNERIGLIDEKLAAKRARLQAQFLAMETAIAQLQSQNSALSSLSG